MLMKLRLMVSDTGELVSLHRVNLSVQRAGFTFEE
jgi:hypothetical protein